MASNVTPGAVDRTNWNNINAELTALQAGTLDGGSPLYSKEVTFTETGAGTYTGAVTQPAGSTLHDIIISGVALWDAATSASMEVGDANDPDGYWTAVDLKATDLLANEALTFANKGSTEAGAYFAGTQSNRLYTAADRVLTATVVSSGAGSAGRTRVTFIWSKPTAANITAATKA